MYFVIMLAELRFGSLCHSVCLSVFPSVSRITHDRSNGCRSNMVGMGKGKDDPCRNYFLVLIRIRMWILGHFSIFFVTAS